MADEWKASHMLRFVLTNKTDDEAEALLARLSEIVREADPKFSADWMRLGDEKETKP